MNSHFSFEEEIDLSRFNNLYRSEPAAQDLDASYTYTIPDGRYEVVVAEAVLTRSQSSGNPMVRYVLRITGSTFRDRILRKHSVITENSMPYFRRELETCGLRLERFEDLKTRIKELEGIELEVAKTTKGDNSNIYFNRRLTSHTQADGVADDDLPF
jgi:hypothetical protein